MKISTNFILSLFLASAFGLSKTASACGEKFQRVHRIAKKTWKNPVIHNGTHRVTAVIIAVENGMLKNPDQVIVGTYNGKPITAETLLDMFYAKDLLAINNSIHPDTVDRILEKIIESQEIPEERGNKILLDDQTFLNEVKPYHTLSRSGEFGPYLLDFLQESMGGREIHFIHP